MDQLIVWGQWLWVGWGHCGVVSSLTSMEDRCSRTHSNHIWSVRQRMLLSEATCTKPHVSISSSASASAASLRRASCLSLRLSEMSYTGLGLH